jgi:hypothetical protein
LLQFFFQTIHAGNAASGPWFTNEECGETIVWGMMDAGINNVIYMELHSGPKMANGTCRKMIVVGTIDRGSTVYIYVYYCYKSNYSINFTEKFMNSFLWTLMLSHTDRVILWKFF